MTTASSGRRAVSRSHSKTLKDQSSSCGGAGAAAGRGWGGGGGARGAGRGARGAGPGAGEAARRGAGAAGDGRRTRHRVRTLRPLPVRERTRRAVCDVLELQRVTSSPNQWLGTSEASAPPSPGRRAPSWGTSAARSARVASFQVKREGEVVVVSERVFNPVGTC
jgi:hypothetical protein